MSSSSGSAVIISPAYCKPHPVELAIVRKLMARTQDNFTVTDADGNVVFNVKPVHLARFREHKTVQDPAGNVIVTLRQKAMTVHSRWHAFRGDSTEPKDLIFSTKRHTSFMAVRVEIDVFLAANAAERVCDFKVKGSYMERSCVVYAGADKKPQPASVVAQMQKKHTAKSMLLGKDHFMVTVKPNVDTAFMVALIVLLDDMSR